MLNSYTVVVVVMLTVVVHPETILAGEYGAVYTAEGRARGRGITVSTTAPILEIAGGEADCWASSDLSFCSTT